MPKPLRCPRELLSIDLSGKTYLVTGGNSGIGYETVQQLARQGAKVVLACRRPEEGRLALNKIKINNPTVQVEVLELDLASLESVRSFSKQFLEKYPELHGLINNAGVMNTPFGKTKDGFEIQFGTNHLGHYLLTELLLPVLKKSAPSRIVNLSSCYHDRAMGREGTIDFDDLNFERRKYDGWKAYAQSKLANLLHAKELARRLSGTGVTAVSVHPGWVRTNLFRSTMPLWIPNLLRPLMRLGGMIEPWEGAQTTLYALLSPEVPLHSGAFFSQIGFYRTWSARKGGWPLVSPNPNAHDDESAKRLDQVSRSLVGLNSNLESYKKILGYTPENRPLEFYYFGPPPKNKNWILLLGGVHGDETEGVWLMEEAILSLLNSAPNSIGVGILPKANPDGIARTQRCNSRGVDLNRNLPSRDWTSEVKNPKYPPGPSPASEVENQVLVKLIIETPPRAILSAHSFHRYQVNVNGPSEEWGQKLSELCGYPVTQDIGYPTPGCLGTYSGKELGIPTITLEIERGLSKEKVISLHLPLIHESVQYWSKKEML